MQVESTSKGHLLIVKFQENRLDSSQATELQEFIQNWTEKGHCHIILDLSAVDFIDSTILGVIVQWFKVVRSVRGRENQTDGGNLVICNIGFKIRSLFQLTRMDRVFTIFEDEQEAIIAMTG